MEFSEKLKQTRKALNLTQMELAKILGVAFTTVNRWENERVMPNYRTLKKFEVFCENNSKDLCVQK
ncbi:MAG: helix-turn-helix domain-containing protein [Firmicutes bacterium]|nr:helix-turn-helix domain-containing protein [Bacillota bacterium]